MNEQTAIVQAGSGTIPDDVRQMAALIRAMLPNGMNLTEQEALAGAMYGKAHGLDPFRGEYFIIPKKGIFPGYRGEMKQAGEYYTQTRPMRGDEADEHEIMPGDSARIVELFQPSTMAQMRLMGVQYQPILGVGIVRKSEKYTSSKWVNGQRVNLNVPEPIDPPTGRSWAWKAEQRALKDALRHMQGGAAVLDETVDDRLREADDKAQSVAGEFRQLTEDEQRERFATNVATMRGPKTDDPFGVDAPPAAAPKPAPAPPSSYVSEDGVRIIIEPPAEPPPSDTERTAQAIRARIVGTTRPDETKAHSDIITKLQGGLHIAVPNDDERHALEVFMLGSDDSSTWTQGQVMAMRTWLNISKAGDGYAPSAKFLEDWKIVRAAIMPPAEAEIVGK